MPKRRFRSPLHQLLYKLGHKPADLFKVFPYIFLILTLCLALSGFGGFMEYASPLEGVSYALLGLTGTHALVVLFRRKSLGLGWEAILPVPFLLLVLAHFWFHSPVPWSAGIGLVVLVEAYVIFLVAYNSILGRPSALLVIISCEIVVMLALLGGFLQFYLRPDGLMPPGRMRFEEYAHGMGGFIMDPQILASMLILFWPLTVIIAWIRRFPALVRVPNAFGAITIPVGLLLSANLWGIVVSLLMFLAFPLFLTGYPWRRRKLWLYGSGTVALLLAICWHLTEDLQQRMLHIIMGSAGPVDEASRAAALREFLDAPLLGQGLGSFGTYWDAFNPGIFLESSLYSRSGILHLLAETGLAGLVLAMGPILFFLVRAWHKWRRTPHVIHDPDVLRRLKHLSPRKRAENKLARKQSRHSSHKILLGGLVLGMTGCLVYQLDDYSLLFPLHIFLGACLLACLAVIGSGYQHRVVTRPVAYLVGFIPLFLAIGCCLFGIPRFKAQHLYYTSNEKLQSLLDDPERIFEDPAILEPIEMFLQRATDLYPKHADAWIALAECRLASLYAEERPAEMIAASAEIPLLKASEILTASWKIHYLMARTTILRGEDSRQAMSHLEQALELAPGRPEPGAFLGMLLLMEDYESERGRYLIGEALSKYPRYELLQRLKPWIELSNGSGPEPAVRSLDGSLVTPAFIARLFAPLPDIRERVRGAGLPVGYY